MVEEGGFSLVPSFDFDARGTIALVSSSYMLKLYQTHSNLIHPSLLETRATCGRQVVQYGVVPRYAGVVGCFEMPTQPSRVQGLANKASREVESFSCANHKIYLPGKL